MQTNTLLKKILLLTIPSVILLGVILYFIPRDSAKDDSLLSKASASLINSQTRVNRKLPVRLSVPKINVDADIEYVSAKDSGEMEAPKNYLNVAWYSLGKSPGEVGSAVIAGHLDNSNGSPSIFYNLNRLEIGDSISIENNDGSNTVFIINNINNIDYEADATDVFSSSDGKAHLNLVTCSGEWDKKNRTYTKRLIVYSEEKNM